MRSGRSLTLFNAMQDRHREAVAAAPVPRNARVPGSPEWCYQTMSLLKHSYRDIRIDQDSFAHYLNELREHRAWEKVPVDHPYGSEAKMIEAELGKRIEEVELELDTAKQDLHAQKNKVLDVTTPDLKEAHRPKNEDKPDTQKNDVRLKHYGNTNTYAIAKLRRDRPDIHARVLAGELTANAGMVEADFRKKAPSKKKTILQKIQKLLPQLTKADRQELRSNLDDLDSA